MKDRYKLSQFYSGPDNEIKYSVFQEITEGIYLVENLALSMLTMDFPIGTKNKHRQKLEEEWKELLPKLDKVKTLSVRHRVKQDFFDAVCEMKNLENLHFWTSTVEQIKAIANLQQLTTLQLESFSRLKDISPLRSLKNLRRLAIENCFQVENYEIIGEMSSLIGLQLKGNCFAPRNLRIKSLKPFESLKNMKHLDISFASIIDNSYESILQMPELERFDITVNMPKLIREKIKANHQSLKAGFFMDWDYEKNTMLEGKEW